MSCTVCYWLFNYFINLPWTIGPLYFLMLCGLYSYYVVLKSDGLRNITSKTYLITLFITLQKSVICCLRNSLTFINYRIVFLLSVLFKIGLMMHFRFCYYYSLTTGNFIILKRRLRELYQCNTQMEGYPKIVELLTACKVMLWDWALFQYMWLARSIRSWRHLEKIRL